MDKVALVIPAYNEEKRIGKTLEEYSKYFENLRENKKIDYEILIVINNTTDNTEEIVKELASKNRRIDHLNLPKGGKGYAVIEGFKESFKKDFDLIGFVDSDMATSPEEFYKLIQNIKNHDGIIADRYMRNSKVFPPATFRRIVVRRIFNYLSRSLLFIPYKDTQCGAKLFRKEALEKTINSLSTSQWAFDVDLLYNLRKKGFKVVPHPTIWIDKEYSKINLLSAGPSMTLAIIRLRIFNSPFKRFIKIYDRFVTLLKNER